MVFSSTLPATMALPLQMNVCSSTLPRDHRNNSLGNWTKATNRSAPKASLTRTKTENRIAYKPYRVRANC
jgi:hypothetical protein